jgi:hypothetical protein
VLWLEVYVLLFHFSFESIVANNALLLTNFCSRNFVIFAILLFSDQVSLGIDLGMHPKTTFVYCKAKKEAAIDLRIRETTGGSA